MLLSGFFGGVFRRDDKAGSWVSVPRHRASARRERGERLGFRAGARWGEQGVHVPTLALARSRCCWLVFGRMGMGFGMWWVWEVVVFPWDDEAGSWVGASRSVPRPLGALSI